MVTAVVIDDEPIVRMDFTEMLRELEIDVLGAGADGFDAVDLCRKHRPQLVLMDIKMPVFDGLDASKTILREFPEICIVLITAFNDNDFIQRAKEIGVAGYLVKPIDERSLKPALEIAMAQHERYNRMVSDIQNMEEKLRGRNTVDRAKFILAKRENISEGEAYGLLQRMSMDKRCSMEELAKRLVQQEDMNKETLNQAKQYLMDKYGLSDTKAYERIRNPGMSILNIQARKVESEELKKKVNRILSIAAIHDLLTYQTEENSLSVHQIAEKIVRNIFVYSAAEEKDIKVHVLGDDVLVNSDRAVSIAVIINELVTNALKHAFAGRDEGLIEIHVGSGDVLHVLGETLHFTLTEITRS